MSPTPVQPVQIPGAFNLRELGGYQVEGGVIRNGAVYRSDLLNRLDQEQAHTWLSTQDIRVLVDLRTLGERDADGHLEASDALDARHRSLLDEVWSWSDEQRSGSEWFLRDRTIEMYERFPDRIITVLDDLASSGGGALFHCTAGKDRTGVIASAFLGVLGASHELIIADYARSTEAMVGIVGWYRDLAIAASERDGTPLPSFSGQTEDDIIARAATPETMRGVIDAIVERHGSYAGWAADVGIDPALIAALRAKFVV